MNKEEKQKIDPEAYNKIKGWENEGKTVYEFRCENMACLRRFFTPNKEQGHCPRCHCLVGMHQFKKVFSKDFKVEKFTPEVITKDDLQVSIDGRGRIVLEIQKHWRPINIGYLPTGDFFEDTYHQMRYGSVLDEDEAENTIREIDEGKFIDEHFEMLQHIVKDFGFELEEKL